MVHKLNILSLLGRDEELLTYDIEKNEDLLSNIVSNSKFLVLGAAGSIGQAVSKEIFKRNPEKLHVVDISENNLVELIRDLRSSYGYIKGEFKSFALDIGSIEYDYFINSDGQYDYVLNLSALKHVRSEKDRFTLMRMIDVNIFNTDKTILHSIDSGVKKYFCVSTDKAANPVNMMGASKRIMEMFLMRESELLDISTARFANVAFSDGSLLHGFDQRIQKKQPIVAPNDIKRYFVTPKEAGELCIMSCIFGDNRDIFFPKLSASVNLITFSDIAARYLKQKNYKPFLCKDENEARRSVTELSDKGYWPCLFTSSNTTGEKEFEEFYAEEEILEMDRFNNLGIIKNNVKYDKKLLDFFENEILKMKHEKCWTKQQLLELFFVLIPNFKHMEKGKYLDSKM